MIQLDDILNNLKTREIGVINTKLYRVLNGYKQLNHKDVKLLLGRGDILKYASFDMSKISLPYVVIGIDETTITLLDLEDKTKIFKIKPRNYYLFYKMVGTGINKELLNLIKNMK
jgi:hypothetical protein